MTVPPLTLIDGGGFMQRCLDRAPAGRGVPRFLSAGSTDSLEIVLDPAIIDLPPWMAFDCATGAIRQSGPARHAANAQYVMGLHGGILLGAHGHVATADGAVLIESMRDASLRANPLYAGADLEDPAYLAHLSGLAAAAEYRPGRWLSLVYALSVNWYHWLIENVGRLPAARAIPDFAGLKVIVPPGLGAAQRELLAAMGVARGQIVEHDGRPWACEELYLPSFGAVRASFHPRALAALKDGLRRGLDLPAGSGTRRLLLSRADAPIRRVLNQDALAQALAPLGVEALTLAGRALREQARIFAEAGIIVAPHGAGLANIVFSAPGTRLVELLPDGPDGTSTLYHALASALSMPYLGILCPAGGLDHDFTVPPETAAELVRALLGS